MEPKKRKVKGLGDAVEVVTKATGIDKLFKDGKDCGCEKRKQWLNANFSFVQPNCFTKEQYEEWTEFKKSFDNLTLSVKQQEIVVKFVREILNLNVTSCPSCSAGIYKTWIAKIDKIYATYENNF